MSWAPDCTVSVLVIFRIFLFKRLLSSLLECFGTMILILEQNVFIVEIFSFAFCYKISYLQLQRWFLLNTSAILLSKLQILHFCFSMHFLRFLTFFAFLCLCFFTFLNKTLELFSRNFLDFFIYYVFCLFYIFYVF